jgi:hypothetical protein
LALNLLVKSSRSIMRATVWRAAISMSPAADIGPNHSELNTTLVRSPSRILKTCCW